MTVVAKNRGSEREEEESKGRDREKKNTRERSGRWQSAAIGIFGQRWRTQYRCYAPARVGESREELGTCESGEESKKKRKQIGKKELRKKRK